MKIEKFTLLSGVSATTTGVAVDLPLCERFTVSTYATGNFFTGVGFTGYRVTGSAMVQGTIGDYWHNIASGYFSTNSGYYTNFTGPWTKIRGVVNPLNSGVFYMNVLAATY